MNSSETYNFKDISFFSSCEKSIIEVLHGFFLYKPSFLNYKAYSILLGMEGSLSGCFLNSKSIHSQGNLKHFRFLDKVL